MTGIVRIIYLKAGCLTDHRTNGFPIGRGSAVLIIFMQRESIVCTSRIWRNIFAEFLGDQDTRRLARSL